MKELNFKLIWERDGSQTFALNSQVRCLLNGKEIDIFSFQTIKDAINEVSKDTGMEILHKFDSDNDPYLFFKLGQYQGQHFFFKDEYADKFIEELPIRGTQEEDFERIIIFFRQIKNELLEIKQQTNKRVTEVEI